MPSKPAEKPVVNPKTAAIMGVIAALFVAAVAFYPPLQPVCESLGFCTPDVAVDQVPSE